MIAHENMNIDEMEAGRELDALVAEKVMGFYWRDVNEHQRALCPPGIDDFFEILWGEDLDKYVPDYSTDITAAWLVVEKHPHYFILSRTNDWRGPGMLGDPKKWVCRFYAPERFKVVADTAPLAICRAALKAVQETT